MNLTDIALVEVYAAVAKYGSPEREYSYET